MKRYDRKYEIELERWAERFMSSSGRAHLVKDEKSAQQLLAAWVRAGGNPVTPKMESIFKSKLVPHIMDKLNITAGKPRKEKARQYKTFKLKSGKEHQFIYIGSSKGRTVYAREIKTKRGIRFIDRKGRYTSVSKEILRKT